MNHFPDITTTRKLLSSSDWASLTLAQLKKDAELCGFTWLDDSLPDSYDAWINSILNYLLKLEKQNPEYLSRFLYRVDLSERRFLKAPFPSEEMAEAVLKREFMKVWFKNQYRS
jgi:hypothetical protein